MDKKEHSNCDYYKKARVRMTLLNKFTLNKI